MSNYRSDYILLTHLSSHPSPSSAAEIPPPPSRRRPRLLLLALFSICLLVLFALLRITLSDIDDDTKELDFELYPADLNSSHTSYIPFQPFLEPNSSASISLQHVIDLPTSCLDAYFEKGDLCYSSEVPKLDFVWTWVNGSDPLEQQAKIAAQHRYSPDDPWRPSASTTEARLYRDHDELRHSLRSVLLNFRKFAGRFFLITSDFPIPVTTPNLTLSPPWRLGQIPQWLDIGKGASAWRDGDVVFNLVHHADIFQSYEDTMFNSLAIESQLGHIDDVSDYFIYMNDDLYFKKPLTPASFYSSAFGIVLHMEPWLTIPPSRPTPETPGEWRGMGESNYMLGQRFGARHRPYIMHQAKVVSSAMLAELETIWPDAFARSGSHRFRETAGPGAPADINTLFLHAHFIVERAREALLWTWVVARVGRTDNMWGESETRRAWAELGGTWIGDELGEEEIEVEAAWRTTLVNANVERMLSMSGSKGGLGATSYAFSSLDGYAYGFLGYGQDAFPSTTPDVREDELPACSINYYHCFPHSSRASDVFMHIAFKHPECGDCAITSLIRASGPSGISAFLPSPDRELPRPYAYTHAGQVVEDDIPHLPLVESWDIGDFSLHGVMSGAAERNVRQWTLQLLQRYRYVIGKTPSSFERLERPSQASDVLSRLDWDNDIVLLCVNDDVTEGDDRVASMFRTFQEKHWGRSAAWERQ